MLRIEKCLFLLFLVWISFSCGSKKKVIHKQPEMQQSMNPNVFGVNLYAEVASKESGNIFLSPFSLSQALGMTVAGAAGNTAIEMQKVLQFPADPKLSGAMFREIQSGLHSQTDGIQMLTANALWLQQGYTFLTDYLEAIQKEYDAGLEILDFVSPRAREISRLRINAWTSEKTHDHINDLLPQGSLSQYTRLVLTNAIFFSAPWKTAFDPQMSIDLPFVSLDGKKDTRKFMSLTDTLLYGRFDGFAVLDIPYAGNGLSMTILLPDEWNGVTDMEAVIAWNTMAKHLNELRPQEVTVWLPKWKLDFDLDASLVLQEMGMRDAFSLDADFSGMTGRKDLFIDKVLHKAFIDVNEKGTEAAAASAVIMAEKTTAVPNERVYFRADHPFIYLIRDGRSNSIFFIGRLANPPQL